MAERSFAVRPLRVPRPRPGGGPGRDLPAVPGRVPEHVLAPDWSGPTEDNGATTPRGELHVALVAPDAATAAAWRRTARVITPPLWKGGRVNLHVIHIAEPLGDPALLMAMVDLGLIDAKDAGFVGYPSGLVDA